jgi:hypothetical protein
MISSLALANEDRPLTERYCRDLTQYKVESFSSVYQTASIELTNAIESNIYNSCIAASISGLTVEKFQKRKPYVCIGKTDFYFNLVKEVIHIDDYFEVWFKNPKFAQETPTKKYISEVRDRISSTSYKLSHTEDLTMLNYEADNYLNGLSAVYVSTYSNGTRNILNMTCYDVNAMTSSRKKYIHF